MLVPISSQHSINRVIASFFLAQSFPKPEFIFNKLSKKSDVSRYQKKELTFSKTINIENNALNISGDSNNGFLFEEFEEGKSVNVLKVENIDVGKAIVSIENRKYSDWSNFRTVFMADLKTLSETFDVYIEAIGLTYVDEFTWNSNEDIDIKSVFDENADLMNKKFLESYNGTLVSVSQSGNVNEENFREEKTEIMFNNQLKRIVINHTYAKKLNEMAVFSTENTALFTRYFDEAHAANKNVLREILTEKVRNRINLK